MKRQKALLDECVRCVKKASAAASEAERDAAVQEAAKALDAVRLMANKIDDLFAERIDDIMKLRERTKQQAEEAITAAQGALASVLSGSAKRRPLD
jgi:hypothetical protein